VPVPGLFRPTNETHLKRFLRGTRSPRPTRRPLYSPPWDRIHSAKRGFGLGLARKAHTKFRLLTGCSVEEAIPPHPALSPSPLAGTHSAGWGEGSRERGFRV